MIKKNQLNIKYIFNSNFQKCHLSEKYFFFLNIIFLLKSKKNKKKYSEMSAILLSLYKCFLGYCILFFSKLELKNSNNILSIYHKILMVFIFNINSSVFKNFFNQEILQIKFNCWSNMFKIKSGVGKESFLFKKKIFKNYLETFYYSFYFTDFKSYQQKFILIENLQVDTFLYDDIEDFEDLIVLIIRKFVNINNNYFSMKYHLYNLNKLLKKFHIKKKRDSISITTQMFKIFACEAKKHLNIKKSSAFRKTKKWVLVKNFDDFTNRKFTFIKRHLLLL